VHSPRLTGRRVHGIGWLQGKGRDLRVCDSDIDFPFAIRDTKGPASVDPFPAETVAVVVNRNMEMVSVKGGCYAISDVVLRRLRRGSG
jgi:hypothetical protein